MSQTPREERLKVLDQHHAAVIFLQGRYPEWDGTADGSTITLTGCANMMREFANVIEKALRESAPPTAPALGKEALDRLLDDIGIDERLENFFFRHAPVLWDDSWRCTCSQWVLSRERNTVEQANKSRAEHLTEQFRVEFDIPAPQPVAGPSELTLSENQLRVIIYDALKDQFPTEGAAMMVASCCAGPIKRELDRAIAAARGEK